MSCEPSAIESAAETRYLDLLKACLMGSLYKDAPFLARSKRKADRVDRLLQVFAARRGLTLTSEYQVPAEAWETGSGWDESHVPPGQTMVGRARLDQLQECVSIIVSEGIEGDFIEAGVWRGGASILMAAMLELKGDSRRVVLADSFRGLPAPSPDIDADRGLDLHLVDFLAVSKDDVAANFRRYGVDLGRVEMLEGWFGETLPAVKDRAWSLVRLDGDLYESTRDGLVNLYDGLSSGGFIIIDDYGAYEACRLATDTFREQRGIEAPMTVIDWAGIYWRKP